MILTTVEVLPVPGPPVMMHSARCRATSAAWRCQVLSLCFAFENLVEQFWQSFDLIAAGRKAPAAVPPGGVHIHDISADTDGCLGGSAESNCRSRPWRTCPVSRSPVGQAAGRHVLPPWRPKEQRQPAERLPHPPRQGRIVAVRKSAKWRSRRPGVKVIARSYPSSQAAIKLLQSGTVRPGVDRHLCQARIGLMPLTKRYMTPPKWRS